jgi:hypothetical protein
MVKKVSFNLYGQKGAWSIKSVSAWLERSVVNNVSFSMVEREMVKRASISIVGKKAWSKRQSQHGWKGAWSKK